MIYRFVPFEVDDREFRLTEDGETLPLEPKALRLLIYLIENHTRLVRKQELLDKVWPEAMVTENALTRAIGLLRKALKEDSRAPRFIETVPTVGYRFIAQVTLVGSDAPVIVPELAAEPLVPAPESAPQWMTRRKILWTAGAAAVLSTAGFTLSSQLRRRSKPRAIAVTIQLLEGKAAEDTSLQLGTPVVAPNGSAVVFPLDTPTGTYLFLRRLDSSQMTQLEGTEGARQPFWSPDSEHIAFFSATKLKRMPVAGGRSVTLCDVAASRGGTWGTRGVILFAPNLSGIWRVSESGGVPEPVTQLDQGSAENSHRFPIYLPDGNRFLYFARTDTGEKRGIYLESVDRKQPKSLVMQVEDQGALGFDEESGKHYIITAQGDKILAQSFDVDAGKLAGPAQVLMDRAGAVSVSDTGVLVVRRGTQTYARLVWRDRAGKELGMIGERGDYWEVSLSPDGKFVAALKHGQLGGSFVLWLGALPEGLLEPFSDGDRVDSFAWSKDSSQLIYTDRRREGLLRRLVSPKGTEQFEPKSTGLMQMQDVTPDGMYLVGQIEKATPHSEIAWTRLDHPLWQRIGSEPPTGLPAMFSPDGRWLAYGSDRTGEPEVYLMDFPRGVEQRRISVDGGVMPRWRHDGRELFYIAKDGNLVSVEVPGPGLQQLGAPKSLFVTNVLFVAGGNALYDVSADGQRFLLSEKVVEGTAAVEMVLNWPSLLPKSD